jgi:hypothetical protein
LNTSKYTVLGDYFITLIGGYFGIESFLSNFVRISSIISSFQSTVLKKKDYKYYISLIVIPFLSSVLLCLILIGTVYLPFILSSLFFECLNYFMNSDYVFNINFYKDYRMTESIFIQIIALFTMYMLKDSLKLAGLPGLLIIKHDSLFKKYLGISVIGTFVAKSFSAFFNTLSESPLLIVLIKCSIETNSSEISQLDCSTLPSTLKISDLRVDIRQKFSIELNAYFYDNTFLNKIFPLITFAFALFFIFIFFHYCYEKRNLYKSDLEMAKIEQHLITYYFFSKSKFEESLEKVFNFVLNYFRSRNDENSKGCIDYLKLFCNWLTWERCKEGLNWITWKWIYNLIVKKSDADIALEKIRLFLQEEKLRLTSKENIYDEGGEEEDDEENKEDEETTEIEKEIEAPNLNPPN